MCSPEASVSSCTKRRAGASLTVHVAMLAGVLSGCFAGNEVGRRPTATAADAHVRPGNYDGFRIVRPCPLDDSREQEIGIEGTGALCAGGVCFGEAGYREAAERFLAELRAVAPDVVVGLEHDARALYVRDALRFCHLGLRLEDGR